MRMRTPLKTHAGALIVAVGFALVCMAFVTCAFLLAMHGRAQAASPDPLDTVDAAEAECPVDWDYWKEVNPSVCAWVKVPGTSIDYPVVESPGDDPCFYLTHDVYGSWNLWGCPYIDPGCDKGIDSPNVVVYGHNMTTDGSMFHDFGCYHDASFAAGHRYVLLYTPKKAYRLEVLGSKTIDGEAHDKRTEFENVADFFAYRQAELASCDVRLESTRTRPQMFTFCTCSYYMNPDNERTLVFAQE